VAAAAVLLAGLGCGPAWQQRQYDREIERATQAVAAARDDAQRAQAHARRGRAYSEKARYSRTFKLVSLEDYGRLFDLAIRDHERAIALSPADATLYLSRGRTYYDRAALENEADPKTRAWFASAEADFTQALAREPRSADALDMRGLVYTAVGEEDRAIADFAAEMTVEPRLGRLRLAEAHCRRASSHQRAGRHDAAIADYTKAIELEIPGDSCECQPESPLAWEYLEKRQYDRGWEVVRQARSANRWIAPELLERLKKESGRDR
jgi:tetratricopeptide (TPR) repeat protein